jgi:hypothetical protein
VFAGDVGWWGSAAVPTLKSSHLMSTFDPGLGYWILGWRQMGLTLMVKSSSRFGAQAPGWDCGVFENLSSYCNFDYKGLVLFCYRRCGIWICRSLHTREILDCPYSTCGRAGVVEALKTFVFFWNAIDLYRLVVAGN